MKTREHNRAWRAGVGIIAGIAGVMIGATDGAYAQPAAVQVAAGDNCPTYPCKATRVRAQEFHAHDHINVRFRAGVIARERDGQLSDLGTGALAGAEVQALLKKYAAQGFTWMRVHFGTTEAKLDELHATAERTLGQTVANLNQDFFVYSPRALDVAGLDALIDEFNALGIVEMAEPALAPMPLPVPPDYKGSQHYLYPSDDGGVNGFGVRLFNGGTGANVRVCDLEYSWNLSHQDLPAVTTLNGGGTAVDPFADTNHGTAVLGELFGRDNGWGVTGGVYGAQAFVAPTNFNTGFNIATAITNALGTLTSGDVILIEQQIAGPNYTGMGADPQFGLVPVEWNLGIYNAVVTAIGNNVHVVMAAGNGSQNLNAAAYGTGNGGHYPFNGTINSGSIIVGAGASQGGSTTERSRLGFSCYGTRLNLQGWGENVRTTGYGGFYSAEGQNLWYTGTFGGTSSASPIVTSAVALVSSIYEGTIGSILSTGFMRTTLGNTGQAQTSGANPSSQNIGPRPDVLAALNVAITTAPSNNLCANATLLSSPGYGYTTGRVVAATTDGTASCVSSVNPDVWYRFVAPGYAGNLWVSTCGTHDNGQLDTGMDTVLNAFTACGGSEIGCNDDDTLNPTGCGFNAGLQRDSALVIPLTAAGQTYIRVQPFVFAQAQRSAFALGWLYVPANDSCASAVNVSAGGTFFGNLTNAFNDGTAACGNSATNGDIWYRYTACAAGTLTVSTCGTHDSLGADTGVDTVLSLHGSCGGAALDCNDDAPSATNCQGLDGSTLRDSYLTRVMAAGETVLIRVTKYGTTAVGGIRLNVAFSQANDCAFTPYTAVTGANPFCNFGTPNTYVDESNCGATPFFYNSVFYNYTAPSAGQLTVEVCDANFDTKLALYLGLGCPIFPNTAFACNDDTTGCGAGVGSRLTKTVVAGEQLKIRVGAYQPTGNGSGTLNITLVGSASGVCCKGSTCVITTQAACVPGAYGGAVWNGGPTCNVPGNYITPCCKANFNKANGISVQDIFDFLAAWFAVDATADINGASGVSVQDIFDFLAAWFAGGCS